MLELEEAPLVLAAERSVSAKPAGGHHAVAGHDEREAVAGAERARGALGVRMPGQRGELAVGDRLAVGHLPQDLGRRRLGTPCPRRGRPRRPRTRRARRRNTGARDRPAGAPSPPRASPEQTEARGREAALRRGRARPRPSPERRMRAPARSYNARSAPRGENETEPQRPSCPAPQAAGAHNPLHERTRNLQARSACQRADSHLRTRVARAREPPAPPRADEARAARDPVHHRRQGGQDRDPQDGGHAARQGPRPRQRPSGRREGSGAGDRGRRRGLAGLAPAPVGGARRGLLPRRRAPRRPLARHAQRGHDARPVEDRAPGRDRRRLRARSTSGASTPTS